MNDSIVTILKEMGEDPEREGLKGTPDRVTKSFKFLTSGYHVDVDKLIGEALFDVSYDEMVFVKDIEIFSLCEHHLLPFFGKCHVAYIPNEKVVGLSKVPRLVEAYSRRLQIQERLTNQIAETFHRLVQPQGVAVVIEARHLCMAMRGVEQKTSYAVTSAMLGVFKSDQRTRSEFLNLLALHDKL